MRGLLLGVYLMAAAVGPLFAEQRVVYSIDSTDIGTLMEDPKATAIIDKHMPGFRTGADIEMIRSLTLAYISQFAAAQEFVTEAALAKIQADFDAMADAESASEQ